jgi:hypothetical protein
VTVAEFKQRLEKIPLVAAGMGSPVKQREPRAVSALCNEALYSISLNGDTVSRHLAAEMLKAMGARVA